jgi:hypothetical protein
VIHDDPMPDFVAALEHRLRAAALAQAAATAGPAAAADPARRAPVAPRDLEYRPSFRERLADHRPTRRRAFGAAVLVLATLVALVLAFSVRTPPAVSGPDILNAPRVTDPEYLRRLLGNSMTMGPGADYARARTVEAVGGRAYLVPTRRGYWCLRTPDPGSRGTSYAVGCASDATFRRVGIFVLTGGTLVAAVAKGVRDPTLRDADGRVRTLRPNALGVVIVRHMRGMTYTQFARSGPPVELAVSEAGIPLQLGGSPEPAPSLPPGTPLGRARSSTELIPCPPRMPYTRLCERSNRRILAQRRAKRERAKRRAAERAAERRPGS